MEEAMMEAQAELNLLEAACASSDGGRHRKQRCKWKSHQVQVLKAS